MLQRASCNIMCECNLIIIEHYTMLDHTLTLPCCSVLQRVAACCSVLQRVAACCSVLQRVAACCSVLIMCEYDLTWCGALYWCMCVCVCVCVYVCGVCTYKQGILWSLKRKVQTTRVQQHLKCITTVISWKNSNVKTVTSGNFWHLENPSDLQIFEFTEM